MSKSEAAIINEVKLEAGRKGVHLWRNNVGMMLDKQANIFVRFGLANESLTMNAAIKSADLIGIRPVLITQDIKNSDWQYKGTDREQAQLKWAELISSLGGDAAFATGEGTL